MEDPTAVLDMTMDDHERILLSNFDPYHSLYYPWT